MRPVAGAELAVRRAADLRRNAQRRAARRQTQDDRLDQQLGLRAKHEPGRAVDPRVVTAGQPQRVEFQLAGEGVASF
jgi:hypothetical protein